MIPFVLLLVTALLAGWLVFYGALLASFAGPPGCLLGVLGVVGVVVLFVAAYATAWSRPIGFKFALGGLVAIGISLVTCLPRSFSPPGDRAIGWFSSMPSLLIVVATVYVLIGLGRTGSTVLYPAAASRRTKLWMFALTAGLVIITFGWCLSQ